MLRKIITYLLITVSTLLSIFPFYFMFTSATNANPDILRSPPKLIFGSHLAQNMTALMAKINIWQVAANSIIIAVVYTILAILMFTAAGYALAQFEFRGKKLAFVLVMATMMIPQQVIYIPLFNLINRAGLANTHAAVILPLLANAFGIFLMRQNLLAFPGSIIEAARIDGSGEIQTFFAIVIPNLKPAIGALGIYMFTSMWNNFMWPLIILGTKEKYTFPVALAMLDGNPNKKDFAMLMLATSLATLPIMLIFFIFQKQFVAGVMGGAVKE